MIQQSKAQKKQALRKSLMERKHLLGPDEVGRYSKKILNSLSKEVAWQTVDSAYLYLPIKDNKEIDTRSLLDSLRKNYPRIYIDIAPKRAGADVPEGNSYDLVIVPMLGFDRRGFRLGYGGGFYDRFLARNDCRQVIGLAYSFTEVSKIPHEDHDQKMRLIITEKEVISVS